MVQPFVIGISLLTRERKSSSCSTQLIENQIGILRDAKRRKKKYVKVRRKFEQCVCTLSLLQGSRNNVIGKELP